MTHINYKHLFYFWNVAKTGSISRTSELLHITPQTISGQLSLLEQTIGELLFNRVGKVFELTDTGQIVFSYAEEIFSLGNELQEVLQHHPVGRPAHLKIGLTDSIPKSMAYRLIEPALLNEDSPRVICREGKLASLLADLAIHRLDLVLADSPMPSSLNVMGYSHLLGESGLSFLATRSLAAQYPGPFPQCLNGAPLLLPGQDMAIRPRLMRWLSEHKLTPRISGEFDDSALMKAFGTAGAGFFCTPSAIDELVMRQYDVIKVGSVSEIRDHYYAISIERKITHPSVVAISQAARQALFVDPH